MCGVLSEASNGRYFVQCERLTRLVIMHVARQVCLWQAVMYRMSSSSVLIPEHDVGRYVPLFLLI